MNNILHQLYIGAVYDLRVPDTFLENKVDIVIRLYQDRPDLPLLPNGVMALDFPAPDGAGWTNEFFVEVTGTIARLIQEGHGICVMCAAGKSRSATIILAYLATYGGMTLDEAWDYLKRCRSVVDPHFELLTALVKFLGVHPYLSTLVKYDNP